MPYQASHPFNNKKLAKRRKELRSQATAPEAVLWTFLQKRQLLGKRFRRQQSIGPYVVDFYCRECRGIVELDGRGTMNRWPRSMNRKRTRYLEQGIRNENRAVRKQSPLRESRGCIGDDKGSTTRARCDIVQPPRLRRYGGFASFS